MPSSLRPVAASITAIPTIRPAILLASWYDAPAAPGTSARVRIGAVVHEVVISDGVFAVPAGAPSRSRTH